MKRRDLLLGGLGMIALTGYAAAQDDPAAARPKPGDVLVRDGDARVIRRREAVDDLLRYEAG